LPHTSACVERIFSQLSLIKTKLRNKLAVETCSSIILSKQLMAENYIHGICLKHYCRKDGNVSHILIITRYVI